MLSEFFTFVQHQLSNIHESLFTNSIYHYKLKIEAEKSLILAVLSKLMDSDDKNSTCRKTRLWIKWRIVSGYFTI